MYEILGGGETAAPLPAAASGRAGSITLSPGDYQVDAFHITAARDKPINAGATAPRWRLPPIDLNDLLRSIVFIALLLTVVLAVARSALVYAVIAVLVPSMLFMMFWPRLRMLEWIRRLENRLLRVDECPDGVIVLTRLPAGTRTATLGGCSFGPGAFPAPAFEVVMEELR